MSKKQVETYLCFNYQGTVKKISKLVISNKGDIFLSLPFLVQDSQKTFLVHSTFTLDKIYASSGIKELGKDDFIFRDISLSQKTYKLSYHPDGFTQFSGTGKIISGRNSDGSSKGFGHLSNSFDSMCSGPFIGIGFNGNLGKFENFSSSEKYVLLPIFHRGITNKHSYSINKESNLTLEFFLRKYNEEDPRLNGEIYIHPETMEPLSGIFPHPDEGYFTLVLFEFFSNNTHYIIGARLLVWEDHNDEEVVENSNLRYSMGPSIEIIDQNQGLNLSCFHGEYWEEVFKDKITRTIDIS